MVIVTKNLRQDQVLEMTQYPVFESQKEAAAVARPVLRVGPILFTLPVLFSIELDAFITPAPPTCDKISSEHFESTIASWVMYKRLKQFLQTRLARMQVGYTREDSLRYRFMPRGQLPSRHHILSGFSADQ
jgi:hypothetical protein